MTRVLLLLLVSLLSAAGQNVVDDAPPDQHWALDLIAPDQDVGHLRDKFLKNPSISAEIKRAIDERVVVPGMCPLEAFAAAGLPRHYGVFQRNPKQVFTPAIMTAQCEHPDDNVAIELLFRSGTQFHTPKPVIFRVRFESGRAVFVDRERRFGRPRQTDE